MPTLSEITPKDRQLVIDLVKTAGVDVADWANCKGGENSASWNPKYCYEWSFIESNKLVVLNLWLREMQEQDGLVTWSMNMRKTIANHAGRVFTNSVLKRRAQTMDVAIQTALRDKLPVRVIVLEGEKNDLNDSGTKASRVHKRLLDPVSWAITDYDWRSGQCTITRGAEPGRR